MEQIAQFIVKHVRKNYYDNSMKSANKTRKQECNTMPYLLLKDKSSRLYRTNEIYNQKETEKNNLSHLMEKGLYHDLIKGYIEIAKNYNSRECIDLAILCYDYAIEVLNQKACIITLEDPGGHTICIIGNDIDNITRTLPEHFPLSHLYNYGSLAICDPWINIACLPRNFNIKVSGKMSSWGAKNKFIKIADSVELFGKSEEFNYWQRADDINYLSTYYNLKWSLNFSYDVHPKYATKTQQYQPR